MRQALIPKKSNSNFQKVIRIRLATQLLDFRGSSSRILSAVDVAIDVQVQLCHPALHLIWYIEYSLINQSAKSMTHKLKNASVIISPNELDWNTENKLIYQLISFPENEASTRSIYDLLSIDSQYKWSKTSPHMMWGTNSNILVPTNKGKLTLHSK